MEAWLSDFTLDLGNGETFQPYDTDAASALSNTPRPRLRRG
jgi:hypothetical protein